MYEDPHDILDAIGDEDLSRVTERAGELCHELPLWVYGNNVERLMTMAAKLAVAECWFMNAIDDIAYQERVEARI